jgi:hypothetical protein
MSWFRRSPHRSETEKKLPHRPNTQDSLKDEIEANRQQLEQYRKEHKEHQDGKLH